MAECFKKYARIWGEYFEECKVCQVALMTNRANVLWYLHILSVVCEKNCSTGSLIPMTITVFWVVMLCSLVCGYHRLRNFITYTFCPGVGGDKFLQNSGNHLHDHIPSQLSIQLTSSPNRELRILISVWIFMANERYTLPSQKWNKGTRRN
jgi:hypothetical protein